VRERATAALTAADLHKSTHTVVSTKITLMCDPIVRARLRVFGLLENYVENEQKKPTTGTAKDHKPKVTHKDRLKGADEKKSKGIDKDKKLKDLGKDKSKKLKETDKDKKTKRQNQRQETIKI